LHRALTVASVGSPCIKDGSTRPSLAADTARSVSAELCARRAATDEWLATRRIMTNYTALGGEPTRSPRKRFSTRPLGSLRKEEDGVPRTRGRAPSTRPHSDNFAIVGCSTCRTALSSYYLLNASISEDFVKLWRAHEGRSREFIYHADEVSVCNSSSFDLVRPDGPVAVLWRDSWCLL
jgi:hypothetical protein